MKLSLSIILFFLAIALQAQPDSMVVKERVARFENALITKNYQVIEELLNNYVSFGHSTGWIQTKQDIINDCKSGKLSYYKIERNNMYVAAINKDWATVRYTGVAEGVGEGKNFNISLHVLQVWVKEKNNNWQLVARQATKLPVQIN